MILTYKVLLLGAKISKYHIDIVFLVFTISPLNDRRVPPIGSANNVRVYGGYETENVREGRPTWGKSPRWVPAATRAVHKPRHGRPEHPCFLLKLGQELGRSGLG